MKKTMKTKERTRRQWIQLVESSIAKSTTGKKVRVTTKDGTGMHALNDWSWLGVVINEVIKSMPTTGHYDGNLFAARRLGVILLAWYARVHRAKTFDPARPIAVRKRSYEQWLGSMTAILQYLIDDRDDPLIWSGQKWDNPYGKKAKGGKFV